MHPHTLIPVFYACVCVPFKQVFSALLSTAMGFAVAVETIEQMPTISSLHAPAFSAVPVGIVGGLLLTACGWFLLRQDPDLRERARRHAKAREMEAAAVAARSSSDGQPVIDRGGASVLVDVTEAVGEEASEKTTAVASIETTAAVHAATAERIAIDEAVGALGGDEDAAAAPSVAPVEPEAPPFWLTEPVWRYVDDNGRPQPAMTMSELVEHLGRGSVTQGTFVWRRGKDTWVAVRDEPSVMAVVHQPAATRIQQFARGRSSRLLATAMRQRQSAEERKRALSNRSPAAAASMACSPECGAMGATEMLGEKEVGAALPEISTASAATEDDAYEEDEEEDDDDDDDDGNDDYDDDDDDKSGGPVKRITPEDLARAAIAALEDAEREMREAREAQTLQRRLPRPLGRPLGALEA